MPEECVTALPFRNIMGEVLFHSRYGRFDVATWCDSFLAFAYREDRVAIEEDRPSGDGSERVRA
jgi:hypothetical protein